MNSHLLSLIFLAYVQDVTYTYFSGYISERRYRGIMLKNQSTENGKYREKMVSTKEYFQRGKELILPRPYATLSKIEVPRDVRDSKARKQEQFWRDWS